MRRESSTVVVLVGAVAEPLLAGLARSDDDEGTDRVLQALRALRHGPWWPPLDQQIDSARHFFAGGLAEGVSATPRAANAGQPMAALPAHPREYG